jgi:hypothetical protein
MNGIGRRRSVALLMAVSALSIVVGIQAQTSRPNAAAIRGGNGTMYMGGWPDKIFIIDEATEKVTGSIPLQTGTPRSLDLSHDRTRFYVRKIDMEEIEVVDIAGRKSIDRFKLSEGANRVRIFTLAADPQNRYLVLVTVATRKRIDRFEIGPTQLLVYDLNAHKVTRTIPWAEADERVRPSLIMSPDGKYLYAFSDDVLVYETTDFKQVDRWELTRPIEEGLGRFEFGPLDQTYEEPGFFTTIVYTQDPVQKRQIMGVARMNLVAKSVDFFPLGPTQRMTFALGPDRKSAWGLFSQMIGQHEFWRFDLERRRVVERVEFEGRPRMALRVSSNGKLLYIWQSGNTIDLYDSSTYKHLRRITLDFDHTSPLVMIPARSQTLSSAATPGAASR